MPHGDPVPFVCTLQEGLCSYSQVPPPASSQDTPGPATVPCSHPGKLTPGPRLVMPTRAMQGAAAPFYTAASLSGRRRGGIWCNSIACPKSVPTCSRTHPILSASLGRQIMQPNTPIVMAWPRWTQCQDETWTMSDAHKGSLEPLPVHPPCHSEAPLTNFSHHLQMNRTFIWTSFKWSHR